MSQVERNKDAQMIKRIQREFSAKLLKPKCRAPGCSELAWNGRCLVHYRELVKCIRDHRAEIYKSHYWDGEKWLSSPATREN